MNSAAEAKPRSAREVAQAAHYVSQQKAKAAGSAYDVAYGPFDAAARAVVVLASDESDNPDAQTETEYLSLCDAVTAYADALAVEFWKDDDAAFEEFMSWYKRDAELRRKAARASAGEWLTPEELSAAAVPVISSQLLAAEKAWRRALWEEQAAREERDYAMSCPGGDLPAEEFEALCEVAWEIRCENQWDT